MRELFAALIALFLLFVALTLGAALQRYRLRRERARDADRARGREVIAELPAGTDLLLFSEDDRRFYYGEQPIEKDDISAVRLLVNGAVIAGARADGTAAMMESDSSPVDDRPEGILRDRWDVVIDTGDGPVVVECGAIRERVSQELARAIYDAIKRSITTPARERRRDG
jgi:hypothetical protein